MGKSYANKRPKNERPLGDFYATPKSLVWVAASDILSEFSTDDPILEPCSGDGAISEELKRLGFQVTENDLYREGKDYLQLSHNYRYIITNPPFSLWDHFVDKATKECDKVMLIGRLNYFGTASRLRAGMWKNMKYVYCFNRYVDYRTPPRNDGKFHVGAMATAWFLWDKSYEGEPTLKFLDVQDYASLGNYKD